MAWTWPQQYWHGSYHSYGNWQQNDAWDDPHASSSYAASGNQQWDDSWRQEPDEWQQHGGSSWQHRQAWDYDDTSWHDGQDWRYDDSWRRDTWSGNDWNSGGGWSIATVNGMSAGISSHGETERPSHLDQANLFLVVVEVTKMALAWRKV